MKSNNVVKWDPAARAVQQMVQEKAYAGRPANSFEPFQAPADRTMNGIRVVSDLRYGVTYPNSFLDLMLPLENGTAPYPVIVYFHGGGFLFGSKSMGDPLAAEEASSLGLLYRLMKDGYAVVNCDYALAPDHRFPVPALQADEVLSFLKTISAEYGLDMDRIAIMGSSAGAATVEFYCAAVSNPSYAEQLGLAPVVRPEQIRCAVVDEAALNLPCEDENMNVMIGSFLGVDNVTDSAEVKLARAHDHVMPGFPPVFVTASNAERFYRENLDVLLPALEQAGVRFEAVFPEPESFGTVPHGFLAQLGTPASDMALERLLSFLKQYL